MKRKERIQKFVKEIWAWYAIHKRKLPWRDLPDRDPVQRAYKVLVSEIMLQQTQVSRVLIAYRNFLKRFPTLQDLAETSNKEVLIAWRGMGYNSRALRLRDAAEVIRDRDRDRSRDRSRSRARFPDSMEELTSIPGVGHYTAAAIRNFALGIPTPCLDTNIRRILHRTFVGPEHPDGSYAKDDQYLLAIADEVLKEALKSGTTQDWHAALMDFGSLVQTKRNPQWEVCPLTAKKLMKTRPKTFSQITIRPSFDSAQDKSDHPTISREPGRNVGSTFIPNRIFRGRIIDALRDVERGLTFGDIGKQVAIDWDKEVHETWLRGILKKLQEEKFLELKRGKYALRD